MHILGLIALIISVALSLCAAFMFFAGNQSNKGELPYKAASRLMIWQFLTLTLAGLVLLIAFLTDDFSFAYVAEHSAAQMSSFYKASAFWAGHEGSLLLWLWMLSGFTSVLSLLNLKTTDRLNSLALYLSNFVQLFLAITIMAATNPFEAAGYTATGAGLNPLLMHWAMVVHPPTLFMGYAGLTIPFAFAIAALLDRNASTDWINKARGWMLFAWLFLTVGIFLGAVWAYVVLGWGGYWGWDPVENASILPWLACTALLHTFTMYRRRGGMKLWAVALASFSFLMCFMATFITRSGLIQSVHAFPDLRWDLTLLFGGFMFAAAGLTVYLMRTRKKEFASGEFFSDFLSRHFTYYLNSLLLVLFALVILGATVIPPFFQTVLGPEFYNRLAGPLGLVYLLIITICPFLGWTQTDRGKLLKQLALPSAAAVVAAIVLYPAWGDNIIGFCTITASIFAVTAVLELFYLLAGTRARNHGTGYFTALAGLFKHNRSQAAGYMSHLGMAILMFGIAGSMLYVQEIPTVITHPDQVVRVDNYNLVFKGMREEQRPGEYVYSGVLQMRDRENGDEFVRELKPQFIYHEIQGQQTTNAAIHTEVFRDIFVVFNGMDRYGNLSLDIKINPLISFVWAGSLILVLGTLIAMWPKATAREEF
ncbi:MAG: cytochrome c-type biogenesis CcmF C-terminal domain-containing protein [Bacillota bacterium]